MRTAAGCPPSATNTKGAAIEQDELNIMSDSNTNMASAITNAKAGQCLSLNVELW